MARPDAKRAKNRRKASQDMIAVLVHLDCGCCDVTLHFKSIGNVERAFAGDLSSNRSITDDLGVTENVDTFYGYIVVDR